MSRYLWVVKFNGELYLGADLNSTTTALVAAHFFNSAVEADKWVLQPLGTLISTEIIKIIVYVEEIR